MNPPVFAIVDIETTGGFAANNGITEIAIVLHDGKKPLRRFESLVNPRQPIPRFIQSLTGITDEMTAAAPSFEEIAPTVFEFLEASVFVAHNVNFDYSFVKHQLADCGYDLQSKKLCTVRLSRKVFPGLSGYSLGSLCRHFQIVNRGRHRAGGDAEATARLFEHILESDREGVVASMIKGRNKEQYLPPNLPAEEIEKLPYVAGVYYFHDSKGKVIYVGKAKNIRNRVRSHFSNNKPGLQKQEFLRNIFSISYALTGTELMAYLMECVEIKRIWPKYNRSLKKYEQSYGLYLFEDQKGYLRLCIEKIKKNIEPIYTFAQLWEGHQRLRQLIHRFGLCPKLCFIQKDAGACEGMKEGYCQGGCEDRESAAAYNERVNTAILSLIENLPSFVLKDQGRNYGEQSCILIERGKFYGMGFLSHDASLSSLDEWKECLTPYHETGYMRSLVFQHIARWPQKKIDLAGSAP